MFLSDFAADTVNRTLAGAERTAAAVIVDGVGNQFFTLTGTAFFIPNVFEIFVVEIMERRENRVRRRLSQTAESGPFHRFADFFQLIQILHRSATLGDFCQDVVEFTGSDTARRTFSARFFISSK